MAIRSKIKEIVDNIDKFETDTNDNGDWFYTGFGLRLRISFYDTFGETHPRIELDKESKKTMGLFEDEIFLSGDEEKYIFEELGVATKMRIRKDILRDESDKLLNSISFKEEG